MNADKLTELRRLAEQAIEDRDESCKVLSVRDVLQLLDEIERLQKRDCANCYCDTCDALQVKQDEIERLRSLLMRIACCPVDFNTGKEILLVPHELLKEV